MQVFKTEGLYGRISSATRVLPTTTELPSRIKTLQGTALSQTLYIDHVTHRGSYCRAVTENGPIRLQH